MSKGSTLTESELCDTPGSVTPAAEVEYRPYHRLAAAVIRGAIADYLGHRVLSRYGTKRSSHNQLRLINDEARGFLYGEDRFWRDNRNFWFGILGMNGDARTVGRLIKYFIEHADELDKEME